MFPPSRLKIFFWRVTEKKQAFTKYLNFSESKQVSIETKGESIFDFLKHGFIEELPTKKQASTNILSISTTVVTPSSPPKTTTTTTTTKATTTTILTTTKAKPIIKKIRKLDQKKESIFDFLIDDLLNDPSYKKASPTTTMTTTRTTTKRTPTTITTRKPTTTTYNILDPLNIMSRDNVQVQGSLVPSISLPKNWFPIIRYI